MKTITFYSYKGGVGRSLLLANVAKYLSRFGQRVFVMDFDLEAPGLHYKFDTALNSPKHECRGVVDFIHSYMEYGVIPESLEPFVIEVDRRPAVDGVVNLMPAGNVLTNDYWQRLARINWHDLFYSDGSEGIELFLEMKARIEEKYKPDYFLIDSRTGITEVGGVATTILSDYVVCLLLNNRENLDGARTVLRSIIRTQRLREQHPITLIPVVSRLPMVDELAWEFDVLQSIEDFLNEPATDLADTLSISNLSVLHVDREMEKSEALLVDSERSLEDSRLLRDYIGLFAQIVPTEILEQYISPLVRDASLRVLDDPLGCERDLVKLTQFFPHPEPHLSLMKFYRDRRNSETKMLVHAFQFSQLTGQLDEPLLWEAIATCPPTEDPAEIYPVPLEYVEEVWKYHGSSVPEFGITIATNYINSNRLQRAKSVIGFLLDSYRTDANVVVSCLKLLRRAKEFASAFNIIENLNDQFAADPAFQFQWCRTIVEFGDSSVALSALNNGLLNQRMLARDDLFSFVKLQLLAGEGQSARQVLFDSLAEGSFLKNLRSRRPDPSAMQDVYTLFRELDILEELRSFVLHSPSPYIRQFRAFFPETRLLGQQQLFDTPNE
jgi:MinD-like ATPase involved in chromosome partitioning or flagellar assembly